MQNKIEIINKKNSVEINIEGTIGVPEAWQFDQPEDRVTTYEKFRDTVARIAGIDAAEVVVNIRSTGGDVNDALLIHDALTALKSRRRTRCYGYVASAATIIAQAASEGCREISANALYLIHRAMAVAEGNASEMESKLDLLRKTDERIAAIYAVRSGREATEFETLMAENNGSGRWLSPEEVVAAGLADKVINTPEVSNYTVVNDIKEPIIQKQMVKVKNIYTAVLRSLGLTPEDKAEVEITEEQIGTLNQALEANEQSRLELQRQLETERSGHTATREELATVQNRVAQLEAQAKAQPTVTKSIEDPAVVDQGAPQGNAKSYAEDAAKFKK